MSSGDRVVAAAELMEAFGVRTGLASDLPPRRYLWTDAFAVCNYLALHGHTGEAHWLDLAAALVQQVHHVLGRHRADDVRAGWISGLPEAEGERHPAAGGLRIGKPLPERRPGEPEDQELDWDRDGQYFHYLTRWLHALTRAAAVTGEAEPIRHAAELARWALTSFLHGEGNDQRLYWKLSIDGSRPVVAAEGQHDALDGLVAVAAVQAQALSAGGGSALNLEPELRALAALASGRGLVTTDALGIGGLLTSALWLARLAGRVPHVSESLLDAVLRAAVRSLGLVATMRYLDGPAGGRLAFRELGLAIGLAAVERLDAERGAAGHPAVPELCGHVALRRRIEGFWLEPAHRAVTTWREHEDINAVMLATSLLPEGYLG
jgi:hypothetical protein